MRFNYDEDRSMRDCEIDDHPKLSISFTIFYIIGLLTYLILVSYGFYTGLCTLNHLLFQRP